MCENVSKYKYREHIVDHVGLVVVVLAYLSRETSDIFWIGWGLLFVLIQHTTALLYLLSPQFLLPLYIFKTPEDRAIIIALQRVITSSTVQLYKYEALSGYNKSFMAC